MNNFFKVKKASNDITTYLKRNQISIDDNILKQYVRKDDEPIDGLIDFTPEGTYIKWKINVNNNGMGQALINISVIELVIQGKVNYEIEGGKYNLGNTIEIDVNIPVNKDKIKVDFNMTSNIIEVSYIDYYNNEINVVFGSIEE